MTTPTIRVKLLTEGATLPRYATPGSAGMDVTADLTNMKDAGLDVTDATSTFKVFRLAPGASAIIPTGLAVAIPLGYEIQVRPRSGLAAKHGITVLNTPGTVDSDYRGEVGVILMNHGTSEFEVRHGERIAQFVVAEYSQADLQVVEDLDATDRGVGGFGSTGV